MSIKGKIHDEVAAATYLAFDQTRKRIHVSLVSDGIPDTRSSQNRHHGHNQISKQHWRRVGSHGGKARIGVITQGADIMANFHREGE